jgi:hypothetical protein
LPSPSAQSHGTDRLTITAASRRSTVSGVAVTFCGVDGDCRPTRAVLQRLAPDGNSHICAGKSGMIYCFIGGSPKI